ncbi:DEAD/DEAH box helicase [Flaviflexus sp.]|uniref:DEAD/DEAH box helicase n=1 Tax=Flaviflexus sp. TaxID=1969482 RepID=UPI003F9311D4
MGENLSQQAKDLTDEDLIALFGDAMVERGRGYHREDRLASVTVEDSIVARVKGKGRTYLVMIDSIEPFDGRCTCPVGSYCKHMVATLMGLGAGGDLGWRSLLTAMTSTRKSGGAGLALKVDTRSEGGPLTPFRRSKGHWVLLPWPDLTNNHWQSTTDGLDQSHVSLFRHLHRTARRSRPWNSPTDILVSDLGAEGMSFLRQLASNGIEILDPDMETLALADDYWPVRMEIEGAGDITARPVVARPSDGVRAYTVPGVVPVLALSKGKLANIAPSIPTQIQSLIASRGTIPVNEKDRLEFEATFLPAVGEVDIVSPDGSFTKTEFTEPRLHLDVTRPAGLSLLLKWKQARRAVGSNELLVTDLIDASGLADDVAIAERLWAEADLPPTWRIPASSQLAPEYLETFREFFVPALKDVGIEVSFSKGGDIELVRAIPELRINAASERDWLDLAMTVEVDGHDVPLPVLYPALVGGQPYLEFGSVLIKLGEEFDELRKLLREAAMLGRIKGKTISVPAAQLHALSIPDDQLDGLLEDRLGRLRELGQPVDVPASLTATLRPYQEVGYSWLVRLALAQYGGILADDMGLGKTVQVLAAITKLKELGRLGGPVLIVAPTSVVSTWAHEATRFAPRLTVNTVTATAKKREESVEELAAADIVVTSYTLLRLEGDAYEGVTWEGVVLDEAQAVKNPRTIGYRALIKLRREWTFAVTGTPIENTIGDLGALFGLSTPGLLPAADKFSEKFKRPIERNGDPVARALLMKLTKPFLMRRKKSDVARDLPEKMSTVLSIEMDDNHRARYVKQLERERQEVLGLIQDPDGNKISILASLTRLRRLAIDPGLLDDGGPPATKTQVLLEHLDTLIPAGHQVLVFSQFTSYLARIGEQLDKAKISYAYLDGSTRNRDREIQSFKSGEKPVFLISLKAGGVGLTLIEADYVFVMDPWWNPAAEEQAIDRAHRIGQDKHVHVYRMASTGSIEEKVLALQERKRGFAELIDSGSGAPITADDIRVLLE